MPSKIDIFDFDGTLFNSPCDTPKNREKYERATGIPWLIDKEMSRELSKKHGRHIGIRRGWWGRSETLEPPLVPDPAPREWFNKEVCDQFLASKANPDILTLIVTGRFTGLRDHVLRILHDGKLVDVEMKTDKSGKKWPTLIDQNNVGLYCLGQEACLPPITKTPKPSETFPWKTWLFEQMIAIAEKEGSPVSTIEIWEDRDEHVEKFKELHGTLVETVIVNHVKFD